MLKPHEIARDVRHMVIEGSSHPAALMRSAMLAADLALVPAQPSPFDGWASSETLRPLHEARLFRPQLIARFVLNRCAARTLVASEIAKVWPNMTRRLSLRELASVSLSRTPPAPGRLVSEIPRSAQATREVAALAAEIERIARL
jgi:chromosome partitioning protein